MGLFYLLKEIFIEKAELNFKTIPDSPKNESRLSDIMMGKLMRHKLVNEND